MVDRGSFSNMQKDLTFLDDRVRSFVPLQTMTPLPASFQPDPWSVICGRGKESFNHVGNRRFRILCEINLPKYNATKSKVEKSLIVMSIVDTIRDASLVGGFIKQDPSTKRWYEVGDAIAREKVGQQLREIITRQSPSKVEARKEQRRNKAKRRRSSHSNYTGSQYVSNECSTVATMESSSESMESYEVEEIPQWRRQGYAHPYSQPAQPAFPWRESYSGEAANASRSFDFFDDINIPGPPRLLLQSSLDWFCR